MSAPLQLAFSPCPNDTFVFHAWTHGLIPDAPAVQVSFADVDITNTAAQDGRFDVVKVSFAALPWLLDTYRLLPCGGALGRGCGPLVLVNPAGANSARVNPARANSARVNPAGANSADANPAGAGRARTDLAGAHVAVPGERTTAYLLMRLWSAERPPASIEVVPFDKIMPGVRDGRFDAGLVIHEARFTYPDFGLTALADLGQWWEEHTGHPIPLGAILARRELDADRLTEVIRSSVRYAWAHPDASAAFVAEHAAEMDPAVQRQHIELYVNSFTEDLGAQGYAAVRELLARAHDAGLVPGIGSLEN